jgi:hypothetical protein
MWDLFENFARRNGARLELERANRELGALLLRGKAAGETVSAMAVAAKVSRETAHRLMRDAREGK